VANLNPPQAEAVNTLSGPLLVLAGAGTGKTRVVTYRVANLIKHGTRADRILAVTFTNKAAQEMQERIGQQLKIPNRPKRGQPAVPRPQIGTFHSTCVQILKRHARVLGYPEKFAIYDRGDQESVARGVLRELKIHDTVLKPSDFLSIVGRWKNAGTTPAMAVGEAKTDKEHLATSGYIRYQRALKLSGAFDFDDLLLCAELLLTEHEAVRQQESSRFDHVLVDEYQDTNGSQYRIIRAIAKDHRNLCVVGDDDQSIYGWRGAEVRHILNFDKDWPDARVVRLEDNYRSTAAILNTANNLIVFNKHRHDKKLKPARPNGSAPRVLQFPGENEEAQEVVAEISRRLGIRSGAERSDAPSDQPGDFAILFRTNEQPRVFETELRRAKLPYTLTGAQSFFDRKEVRDLLAYLKWIDTPQDEVSLLRIINTPSRGLGAKSVESLIATAVEAGKTVWDVQKEGIDLSQLPPAATKGIESLRAIHATYQPLFANGCDLYATIQQLIKHLRYEDEVARYYPNPEEQEMRMATIQELLNAIAAYGREHQEEATLSGFLAEVTLGGREFGSPKEKAMQRNAIALMTLHSAKGLEFPYVYMVGMEEGLLPHRRSVADAGDAIDEERRLCYVGVTRAQEELTLSMSQARFKWGKERPTFPSRFLYELTGQADHPNKIKSIRGSMAEFSNAGSMAKTPPPAGSPEQKAKAKKPRGKSIAKNPSAATKPIKRSS